MQWGAAAGSSERLVGTCVTHGWAIPGDASQEGVTFCDNSGVSISGV